MSNYYRDQLNAFKDTDAMLIVLKAGGQDTEINHIIYEITKVHPVSPKVIKQRIEMWAEVSNIKISDNTLRFEA